MTKNSARQYPCFMSALRVLSLPLNSMSTNFSLKLSFYCITHSRGHSQDKCDNSSHFITDQPGHVQTMIIVFEPLLIYLLIYL